MRSVVMWESNISNELFPPSKCQKTTGVNSASKEKSTNLVTDPVNLVDDRNTHPECASTLITRDPMPDRTEARAIHNYFWTEDPDISGVLE